MTATQNHDPKAAIQRMGAAGFTLKLRNDKLVVIPASQLSAEQRAFIASHKAALVEALVQPDPAPAENLLKPTVQAAGYVCCAECRHSVLPANTEAVYGWRRCGLDLPDGGGFGQALRRCAEWEAAP